MHDHLYHPASAKFGSLFHHILGTNFNYTIPALVSFSILNSLKISVICIDTRRERERGKEAETKT